MPRILIVDDAPTIQDLFGYIFQEAGYDVVRAMDGRQALAALDSGLPDFMVLDVAMPEMSGREFMEELRRRAAADARLDRIPFVVMTGEDFMDIGPNKVFSSAPGFVCFFPKMTPPEAVLEKVSEVLRG